jgi:steroid delta-isomerase-like uncharacterized protein
MSTAAVDPLWQAWAATWSSHDLDQVLALYTDDCIYEDVPFGAINHGKEELRSFGDGIISGFPDVAFEMTSGFLAGSWAGGEWTMTGTHTGDLPDLPATGKAISVRGSSIIELRDGKIHRCSDYWDLATFLRQIGAMPTA